MAEGQRLSISTTPHPAVCLHSDRPVSGLISERLANKPLCLTTFPCVLAQWSYSQTTLFTVAGAVSELLFDQSMVKRTDFPFHSYLAENLIS